MRYFYGLDLGQISDHSASVIVETHGEGPERTYDVRHIDQHPLGSSYVDLVTSVCTLMARPPLAGDCQLAVDFTGVGAPIFDMFRVQRLQPLGILITGGASWHRDRPYIWHVAKVILTSTVQRCLQSGRLRIGAKLPHAHTLQRELRDFRVKISKAANELYEAREGAHDDLVLSLAIALFAAEHPARRFRPLEQVEDERWFPR